MARTVRRKIEAYLRALAAVRTTDHELALGFAVGTLISVLPTPGFNIVLGFVVLAAYPRLNKLSLFGAMAIFNPLVMVPFHWASYALGDLLFGAEPTVEVDVMIVDRVYNFTRRYLVGNVLVAALTAAVSYPLVRGLAYGMRGRRSNPSADANGS